MSDKDLIDAVKRSDLAKVIELISQGKSINTTNEVKESLLHIAIRHMPIKNEDKDKQIEIIKFLIENRADVNATDNLGLTPYTIAKILKQEDVKKILIEKEAKTKNNSILKRIFDESTENNNSSGGSRQKYKTRRSKNKKAKRSSRTRKH